MEKASPEFAIYDMRFTRVLAGIVALRKDCCVPAIAKQHEIKFPACRPNQATRA